MCPEQALGTSAFVAGAGAFTALALHYSVHASEDELHTPSYPFKHKGTFTTLDTARYLLSKKNWIFGAI